MKWFGCKWSIHHIYADMQYKIEIDRIKTFWLYVWIYFQNLNLTTVNVFHL